jgi:glycosyltransferase involved in cell wall biosynthesis
VQELIVGINATCVGDRPSGAKRRMVHILAGVMDRLVCGEALVLFVPADSTWWKCLDNQENVKIVVTPLEASKPLVRTLLGLVYWSYACRRYGIDVLDWSHQPVVPVARSKILFTVHDIRKIEFSSLPMRVIYNLALKWSFFWASSAVTVSEFMVSQLQDKAGGVPLRCVYNGCEFSGEHLPESAPIDTNYVLAVGHLEDRKNYSRLIEAVCLLRERDASMKLLIVGKDAGCRSALMCEVPLAHRDGVVFLDDVSDVELQALYQNARVFAFPSVYEGFGIPLVEAMRSRTPSAVSAIPVFFEIGEDMVRYFDPYDVSAISSVIWEVWSSGVPGPVLENGYLRSLDFAWGVAADHMLEAYRSCA